MKSSRALYTTWNEIVTTTYKNKNSLLLCSTLHLIAVVEEVYKKWLCHKVLGKTETLQEKPFHQLALI